MKRAGSMPLRVNMCILLYINRDALADMLASTHSVNTLLPLPMTTVISMPQCLLFPTSIKIVIDQIVRILLTIMSWSFP